MRGNTGVEPFAVHADPADMTDLRSRLHATRWPDMPEDAGWSLDYPRFGVAGGDIGSSVSRYLAAIRRTRATSDLGAGGVEGSEISPEW